MWALASVLLASGIRMRLDHEAATEPGYLAGFGFPTAWTGAARRSCSGGQCGRGLLQRNEARQAYTPWKSFEMHHLSPRDSCAASCPIPCPGRPARPGRAQFSLLRTQFRKRNALLAVHLTLIAYACTVAGTAAESIPDRPPVASALAASDGPTALIPDTMKIGDTVVAAVGGLFSDPDGDALTYSAESSATGTVRVASLRDDALTLVAEERGLATITVKARDPAGQSASVAFRIRVVGQVVGFTAGLPQRPFLHATVGDRTVGTLRLGLSPRRVPCDHRGERIWGGCARGRIVAWRRQVGRVLGAGFPVIGGQGDAPRARRCRSPLGQRGSLGRERLRRPVPDLGGQSADRGRARGAGVGGCQGGRQRPGSSRGGLEPRSVGGRGCRRCSSSSSTV